MAAYVTTAGPRRVDTGVLSRRNRNETGANSSDGGAIWSYSSTATLANLKSTGWFSNAGRLGMQEGDVVIAACHNSTGRGTTLNIGMLTAISTSADGAAEFFVGATIAST
jgi:hypothetical protein